MKQLFSEMHFVGGQLSQLRKKWEAVHESYPPNSEFIFTYVTLCTTIEYITSYHLRSELEALLTYTDNTTEEGSSEWIFYGRHPYDQTRGKNALMRLVKKELLASSTLTHERINSLRTWLCDQSLSEFYNDLDPALSGDINGLFKLRHVFVHGRPLRLDSSDNSPFNQEEAKFSLKETAKTLERIELYSVKTDLGKQMQTLDDAIFSYEAIRFYWNRVSYFADSYVASVPRDISYHNMMVNLLRSLKPL